MRIIAGTYRSRVLAAPKGRATRPTSDRLRETLFNVLAPRVTGARFLDLYAGSGANGLEALSRGAAQAVLVEQAAPALAAIRANVAALGTESAVRIEGAAVRPWLTAAARRAFGPFDLILLDPPYDAAAEYAGAMELLGGPASLLVSAEGLLIAEHRRRETSLAAEYGCLRRTRVLEQGDAALSLYLRV